MRIHYLSTHSILEYDEISLLTELGHEVFSNGVYADPSGHKTLPRPGVSGAKYFPEYEKLAREFPKTNLPKELIDPFDLIIVMHTPEWVLENWEKMKGKKVIWRSIGQSTKHVENMLRRCRYEGLNIVRYSTMESLIPDFIGADAYIRFYKDPDEFKDWNGKEKRAINFTQSLKGRRYFCHYDHIMSVLEGFPSLIYGSGNDDLGPMNGGELPFDLMKGAMRDNRVFLYAGTWPACYTLSFIEALLTGIPVVSIGSTLAENIDGVPQHERFTFFEIPKIIDNGVNGFVSDDIGQLRGYIHELLTNHDLAKGIGTKGRETAIKLYGKGTIKEEWKKYLSGL